jgi:hypothetical protein
MAAYNMRGISIVLHVFQDSVNPARKGLISRVEYMVLSYDMILLLHHI